MIAMIAGAIAGKNRKGIVTVWTEGRKTRKRTVEPTPITPSIFAKATVITAKDSAAAIIKAIAKMPGTADDTKLIAF